MSVTVVSCAYGTRYAGFVPRWADAVGNLDPAPDEVIVAADRHHDFPEIDTVVVGDCGWTYPQAFYLNRAIRYVDTEWVCVVDIDDFPMTDALAGLEHVDADVWQMGFVRSDGEVYVVPQLTNDQYLASDTNPYVAASAFRRQAFNDVGGYRDVALQDWDLWRRMATAGKTFESSGRTHFHYMRHPYTRGATELRLDVRDQHIREINLAVA